MVVIAIFGEKIGVSEGKSEAVAAGFEGSYVPLTCPVLVAGDVMRVEPEVVRAVEILGPCGHERGNMSNAERGN